jgi:hypothetical protein
MISCGLLICSAMAIFAFPYTLAEALGDFPGTTNGTAVRQRIIDYNVDMIPIRMVLICTPIIAIVVLSILYLRRHTGDV